MPLKKQLLICKTDTFFENVKTMAEIAIVRLVCSQVFKRVFFRLS